MIASIFAALIALVFAVVLHSVFCRLPVPIDRVIRFLIAGSLVAVVLLIYCSSRFGILSIQTLAGMSLFAFCCELYIFIFTMTISSISANLLIRLSLGSMTTDSIAQRYDSRRMIEARIERLIGSGFVRVDDQRILFRGKGRFFLDVFTRLRTFFGISDEVA